MNNFKWQYYVSKLPLETRLIEQLLEFRQYHCDGRESSTTDIVAWDTMSWGTEEPRMTSHMHRNRLVTATASSASMVVMSLPSFGSFGQAVSEEKIF